MNYPIWELQASGLLIAFVSILHVFVSHFAVGGGLFLVLAETRARRDGDTALLDYVRRHSRFFILLTLVFGAISGVGIWFTITLVHPAATSSLINIFVWGWAIEWTFFLTEIAAAMVYYYGWDRLSARQHLAVGWIYFIAAYLSLVIINGILSFMLTPGRWLVTHEFWDGFFNPTYWSSLALRTFACVGLAGLYAIFTAAFLKDPALKGRVARYAGLGWVLPMVVALPLSLAWFFGSAESAGVGLAEIFGVPSAGFGSILSAAFASAADPGYPPARMALRVALLAMTGALLLTIYVVFIRKERYGRASAAALLACGLFSIGGGEWVREDLRKPFVIGGYMFVNGVRLPALEGAPRPPEGTPEDPFTLEALSRSGVLAASPWVRLPGPSAAGTVPAVEKDPEEALAREARAGAEIYRLNCTPCHTLDGYNALRPLIAGKSSSALEGVLDRLAELPMIAGNADPARAALAVTTWRGRRMPPFAGTEEEERALSVYLARMGGGEITSPEPPAAVSDGATIFENLCAACHGPDSEWPMAARLKGRTSAEFFDLLSRLPELNANMPAFEGTEEERETLADYLASWPESTSSSGKSQGDRNE